MLLNVATSVQIQLRELFFLFFHQIDIARYLLFFKEIHVNAVITIYRIVITAVTSILTKKIESKIMRVIGPKYGFNIDEKRKIVFPSSSEMTRQYRD